MTLNQGKLASPTEKDESKKYMATNLIFNTIAGSLAIVSTAMNIPAKLDMEHEEIWWLGIPANILGISAGLCILFAHEFAAYNLRRINDELSSKIKTMNDDAIEYKKQLAIKEAITPLENQIKENIRVNM